MSHSTEFRRDFWDKKIVEWEDSRYQGAEHAQGFLEKFSTWMGGSLKVRLEACAKLLLPRVAGKSVLEFGCGSGLLASRLMAAGAKSYYGIDISPVAIARADELAKKEGFADRAKFVATEVLSHDFPKADLVIGLGFLDWLPRAQIPALAERIKPAPFLFTFSERRFSIMRYGHRVYTALAYGLRHDGYVPDYYTESDMRGFFAAAGYEKLTFLRDPRMSFGAICHTFDDPSRA